MTHAPKPLVNEWMLAERTRENASFLLDGYDIQQDGRSRGECSDLVFCEAQADPC